MGHAQRTSPPRLITIPISHFCEKARWALERAGIAYVEEPHLQLFHFWPAYRASRGDSVPVLVTSEGVLDDSTRILHWADRVLPAERKLFPPEGAEGRSVEELEHWLDEGLGIAGRLWMYTYVLDQVPLFMKYSRLHGVPACELRIFPLAYPFSKGFAQRLLEVRPTSRDESRAEVDRAFDGIAQRLSDGREFLVGGRFTAADLTFASLAAAVLLPEGYGVALPKLSELPTAMAEQITAWRDHPAGRFALKLYADFRR